MKNLPIQNNYIIQSYPKYYDANNYQIINNQQPKKVFHQQVSSLVLPVHNNLFNIKNQSQQPILTPRQLPKAEINIQNIHPLITPMKSEQRIIRIQKKVFRRNPSPKMNSAKNLNYLGNINKNFYINNNNNQNINDLKNTQNNFTFQDAKSIDALSVQNYEIINPIKNNKIISYNSLNKLEKTQYTSPKFENKLNNQNNNIIYYTDFKNYNNQNLNYSANFNNYITDIIPNENNEKVNAIPETKINNSITNLTYNYFENNIIKYPSSNNIDISKNVNYVQKQNINNKNANKYDLYNYNYVENKDNYFQTDINNKINYNFGYYPANSLKNSRSFSNIHFENQPKNNNNNIKSNNQINLNNHNFIRSISSSNIKHYKKGNNDNNIFNKSEFIPTKKIQNITIVKDPITYNNINITKMIIYLNKKFHHIMI